MFCGSGIILEHFNKIIKESIAVPSQQNSFELCVYFAYTELARNPSNNKKITICNRAVVLLFRRAAKCCDLEVTRHQIHLIEATKHFLQIHAPLFWSFSKHYWWGENSWINLWATENLNLRLWWHKLVYFENVFPFCQPISKKHGIMGFKNVS